jgi:CopA family copper-resistance protein
VKSGSSTSPARRRFVQSLAWGGVGAGLGLWRPASAGLGTQQTLTGTDFALEIGTLPVDFTGSGRIATVVNGQLPGPQLRWRQGDTVTLRVRNALPVTTSIHWHGMILPADMDGVPGLSFMGIAPGATYTYRFQANQAGTYWYHSHSRFQEQTGLYGAIVIEPRGGERQHADRDHVVLLSDWSDSDPEHLYATLKQQSNYYNFSRPTAADFLRDARANGMQAALAQHSMWNRMRMDPSDLADVSAYAYTYLMNGFTPAANWSAQFDRGERVRLRFINGASMSFFDVRIPDLQMTVVAVDGQDVEPVSVDEMRIGPAETCDVIVAPQADRAYTIFAQSMDRSGYARGTLAPRAGMQALVPVLDSRPLLDMGDMMGQMSPMQHGHGAEMAQSKLALGPAVDMRVDTPRTNLDDPGVGLRSNGRRVLTYADLHTLSAPIAPDTSREIVLRLTGNMQRYVWSFDGTRFSLAEPLRLKQGERVRITLINDTMMTHPIHLHGMWSELESPDGAFQVRKHTLVVQPGQKLSYRVCADAVGRWAYHCHLLYHMEAGMFREVAVT